MTSKERIIKYGSNFLDILIEIIHENATKPEPYDKKVHIHNKSKLKNRIKEVCDLASLERPITYDEFWFQAYTKIFYAGTRADKATKEIESVIKFGVFDDFRVLSDKSWNFDSREWISFVNFWKSELKTKSNWLQKAKLTKKWNKVLNKHFEISGINSIMLMTKSGKFEGIRFSSLSPKMIKYINLARKLNELESENINVIEYFTGENYNYEPDKFWSIHKKFAKLIGDITSLHLMMDLGFKTVKPDRVLTYLFYKLGWLECLEINLSKEEVLSQYMKKSVWVDVINKAILLDSVWQTDYSNSLRAIDLWIVKYGQEPEDSFGITKNLQKEISVEKIYEEVSQKM